MTTQSEKTKSNLENLQLVSQLSLSAVAILYVLGFLVVNIHYSRFGVTDTVFLSTKYLTAGVNFLIFHILLSLTTYGLIYAINPKENKLLFLVPFAVIWFLLGFAVYTNSQSSVGSILISINAFVIFLFAYLIYRFSIISRFTFPSFDGNKKFLAEDILTSVLLPLALFILIIISCLTWGRFYWPVISKVFGGGRPTEAIFVINQDETQDIPTSYLPMDKNLTNLSDQVQILFESNDEYFVIIQIPSGEDVVMRLSKDIVSETIYSPLKSLNGRLDIPPPVTPNQTPP